jgi:hypothetical protein
MSWRVCVREGLLWVWNGSGYYEVSGEFGVRTEEPNGERWIGEDELPGILGMWRQGERECELPNVFLIPSMYNSLNSIYAAKSARDQKRSCLTTPDLKRHLITAPSSLSRKHPSLLIVPQNVIWTIHDGEGERKWTSEMYYSQNTKGEKSK